MNKFNRRTGLGVVSASLLVYLNQAMYSMQYSTCNPADLEIMQYTSNKTLLQRPNLDLNILQRPNLELKKSLRPNFELKFLIEPLPCLQPTKGIILVHSHVLNKELRLEQRRVWNITQYNYRRVFILFLPKKSDLLNTIEAEAELYKDILLVNIIESYYNLVFKHVIGLTWAVLNCDSQEIMKMDDDISVNFPAFLNVARQNIPLNQLVWMMGLLQVDLPVERSPKSKWYLSPADYAQKYFPNFLSGWLYFTNRSTVILLLSQILQTSREDFLSSLRSLEWINSTFWIDDVWISGLLAEQLNIPRYSLNSYYTPYSKQLKCCLESKYRCPFLVSSADKKPVLIENAGKRAHCTSCASIKSVEFNQLCPPVPNTYISTNAVASIEVV